MHLLWGMATVACAFPFLPVATHRALKVRWSRQLLGTLGVRLRVSGTPPAGGMLVANHISWLDVYAINALTPIAFVAKDDVRGWPLIGWLSARTETLFLARDNRNAAMRAKERLAEELRTNTCIGVFPEGTTSGGDSLLPFHSALFQSAIEARVRVAPAALRYTGRDGEPSSAPVYAGDTSLWQSLRTIVSTGGLTVHVAFLPALDSAGQDRRQLSRQAHRLIASRLARPGADTAAETPAGLPGVPLSGSRPTDSLNPVPADSLPA